MKSSTKIETRAWEPGDLVKVGRIQPDGSFRESIGVVLKELNDDDQQRIFPAVLVFDIQLLEAREFYIYELELISGNS